MAARTLIPLSILVGLVLIWFLGYSHRVGPSQADLTSGEKSRGAPQGETGDEPAAELEEPADLGNSRNERRRVMVSAQLLVLAQNTQCTPLPGVHITITRADGGPSFGEFLTDERGLARVDWTVVNRALGETGRLVVNAFDSGNRGRHGERVVSRRDSLAVLTLSEAATHRVLIIDQSGRPVEGALVRSSVPGRSSSGMSGHSDSEGVALLGPLAPGLYDWIAESPDAGVGKERVTAGRQPLARTIELGGVSPQMIRVRTDGGLPIQGARLEWTESMSGHVLDSRELRTDRFGNCTVAAARLGAWANLLVKPSDRERRSLSQRVDGEAVLVEYRPQTSVHLRWPKMLPPEAALHVLVAVGSRLSSEATDWQVTGGGAWTGGIEFVERVRPERPIRVQILNGHALVEEIECPPLNESERRSLSPSVPALLPIRGKPAHALDIGSRIRVAFASLDGAFQTRRFELPAGEDAVFWLPPGRWRATQSNLARPVEIFRSEDIVVPGGEPFELGREEAGGLVTRLVDGDGRPWVGRKVTWVGGASQPMVRTTLDGRIDLPFPSRRRSVLVMQDRFGHAVEVGRFGPDDVVADPLVVGRGLVRIEVSDRETGRSVDALVRMKRVGGRRWPEATLALDSREIASSLEVPGIVALAEGEWTFTVSTPELESEPQKATVVDGEIAPLQLTVTTMRPFRFSRPVGAVGVCRIDVSHLEGSSDWSRRFVLAAGASVLPDGSLVPVGRLSVHTVDGAGTEFTAIEVIR